MDEPKNDYILTLFEVCEMLNKSARSVGRYVRKGILHPVTIKSKQGTPEYRFSPFDVDAFKKNEDLMRKNAYMRPKYKK